MPLGFDVTEIYLALHFPVVYRYFLVRQGFFFPAAAEPDLENRDEIRIEIHEYVVALQRSGNHVSEEDPPPQREGAVSCFNGRAAVFG